MEKQTKQNDWLNKLFEAKKKRQKKTHMWTWKAIKRHLKSNEFCDVLCVITKMELKWDVENKFGILRHII